MGTGTYRALVEQTITHDLFGPAGLTEPAEAVAPDKYELLECLGRGGFGVVYKARDRTLHRLVALKFLSDARPADIERFRREGRFTARLNDPAIVQIFELGESAGQPYIAMQYIDGSSLAQAGLDADGVVRAIRTVAGALRHAHEAGIVHRDIKPANVLLDRQGRAYLTDFGIARDVRGMGAAPAAATLSHDGVLIGTPALMPPEQARGDLQSIDARSDVYALGATLFYLLCGRYPFERATLVDALHAVLHDDPPLPRSLNPAIPRAIEAIILKCMQKARAARYPSMAELIVDLDAHLGGRPVESESAAWFRKLVGAAPAKPPSGTDTDLYHTLGIEIAREIAAWDANLYRVSRNVNRLHPQLDSIIDRLSEMVQDHPHFAWARFYRGSALMRRGRLEEALDEMERSIDRLANVAGAQFEMGRLYLTLFLRVQHKAHKHLSRVGTEHHLAGSRGRLQQAVICFREAQRLKQDMPAWQIDYADAVAKLADADYAGCVGACDLILAQDADIEDVWRLRGDALRLSGGDPHESYDQAIRVRRSDHQAYLSKAEAYFHAGALLEGRQCLRSALEIAPENVDAIIQLARACLLEGRRMDPSAATQADGSDEHAGAPTLDDCCSIRSGATEPTRRAELIEEGLALTQRAAALQPASFDAAVTRAELLVERARLTADGAHLEGALQLLAAAGKLDGCQNRLQYLTACVWLERARLSRTRGGDPTDDLERILRFANHEAAQVPDNEPWMTLLAAAQRELPSPGLQAGRPGAVAFED